MSTLVIDPEIAALLPPLTVEEFQILEAKLQAEGCLMPVTVWKGHDIILDGSHRYLICVRLKIGYYVREVELPDRKAALAWVRRNQMGQRNLTPEYKSYLRGLAYLEQRHPQGGDQSKRQNDGPPTDERLAKEFDVSPRTIDRDAVFAKAVLTLPEETRTQALTGKLSKEEVIELAEPEPLDRSVVRDGVGMVITDDKKDVWAALALFAQAEYGLREAIRAGQELAKLAGGAAFAVFVDMQYKELNRMRAELETTRPYATRCPFCYPSPKKSCRECHGKDWVTRQQWQAAQENQRKNVKRAFS